MPISDPNTAFCSAMWAMMKPDVEKNVNPAIRKEAWHYLAPGTGRYRDAEFQIPSEGFYWHGVAWCAAEAKVKGWSAYLCRIGAEGYTD